MRSILLLLALVVSGCVGVPLQEHYMLRSEFYRQLEEARKVSEAEKATLRERIINTEAERAREEGRRIQMENQLGMASTDIQKLKANLVEQTAAAERELRAARSEVDLLITSADRLEKELATTRAALDAVKIESSVILFDDIYFKAGSHALDAPQKARLKVQMDLLRSAEQVSIVGYTDDREPGFGFDLGARRAASVASYLRSDLFVASGRINVLSRGAEDPKFSNSIAEQRALNRRVEVIAIFKDTE